MYYLIRHETHYDYSDPIRENVMELRLHPRSDGPQRCLSFVLKIEPTARVFQYRDALGNIVDHFDIAAPHSTIAIYSESLVETLAAPTHRPEFLTADWSELWELVEQRDTTEMLSSSAYVEFTDEVKKFCADMQLDPKNHQNPFEFCQHVADIIHNNLAYQQKSTRVDSKIDVALQQRAGVCQDFSHIMIAILRMHQIPARYVSGYLFHREVGDSTIAADATHAWIEALLPRAGWIGFDPTANMICGERHIRTAIGRDYSDVPPTKGIFKGGGASELSVSVSVELWGGGVSTGKRLRPVLIDQDASEGEEGEPEAWRFQQQQQ